MTRPTFEELEQTATIEPSVDKPSFDELEKSMFRTSAPTAVLDPNEEAKNTKKIIDLADNLGLSADYIDRNISSFKSPPIYGSLGISFQAPFGSPSDSIIDKSIKAGRQSIKRVNASQAIADAYLGGKDITQLLKDRHNLALEPSVAGESIFSDILYKNIAVAAPMVQSLYEASPFAAIMMIGGGILGGLAGNLVGGPAPEELITVPAGAKAGLTAGTLFGLKAGITGKSAEYWYRQGTGDMIYTMSQKGIDMKYAGPIAAVAGIPYAAIEFTQMYHLTPGLRKGVQDIAIRSMLKAFTVATKRYGRTYVTENIEEVLQEGVMIAAEDLGEFFQDGTVTQYDKSFVAMPGGPRIQVALEPVKVPSFNKEAFIERANRLANTSVEAAKSMLLLPLGGATMDVRTGLIEVKNRNKFISAVRENIIDDKKVATLAADMIKDGRPVQEIDQMLSLAKAGLEAEIAQEAVEKKAEKPPTEAITPEEAVGVAPEAKTEEEKALLGKITAQIRAAESALEELAVPGKKYSFEERAKIAQIRHVLDELKTAVREEKIAKPEVVAKPPAAEAKVEKKPWEMTFADYRNIVLEKMRDLEPDIRAPIADKERPIHKAAVMIAVQEGKPVPREVLEEYKSEKWAQEALKKEAEKTLERNLPIDSLKTGDLVAPEGKYLTAKGYHYDTGRKMEVVRINPKSITLKVGDKIERIPREAETITYGGERKAVTPLFARQTKVEVKEALKEPAKVEKVVAPKVRRTKLLTEDEVHSIMSESLDKNEYAIYLQDEVQARTTGDQEAATRAFDKEAQVMFERGYLYNEKQNQWARVSREFKKEVEVAKAKPLAAEAKVEKPPAQVKPKDILGGVDPINQIHIALKAAKQVQPITEVQKKTALKARVGAAAGALKTNVKQGMPTEEAIFKSTGLLKGPLAEYDQVYESIEDTLEPGTKEAAYQMIYNHPELKYFETLNTTTSFKKLLAGSALTPGDVQNIERVFGKTFEDITKVRETRSGLYERLITFWKAGLLTGIKTSGLNTLANVSHSVSETAKDVPASLVDSVASLFTGERALAFTARGIPGGVKEGFERGWKYLKTGVDVRNVGAKLDYKRVNFGNSKFAQAIQAYEETIFHLLGAEDQPFYYGAKARSLYSQAIAQAINKGLKGEARIDYVNNLIKSPTDEMLEYATHDAEVAVFQNKTNLGDLAKAIQKVKGGEVIVPFGRTPSAVAMQIINYSPIGGVKEVAEQIHAGKFDQRKFSQAFGRAAVGTGALYIGGLLFKAGLITLDYPDNERERELWKLEGRQANSILIYGKWRTIQTLGPVGNVLIIGGHFEKALKEEGSPTRAIVTSLAGGAKSFSEQTFVRGVNLAVDALTAPERSFENWFSSMSGSVVPTIVGDIARAQDEQSRRATGPKERIQARIPVWRKGLEPSIDVFGQDLPRYGGNVLETMADPTRPSKIRQDVVVDELRRLFDKDIKVSPTLLGDKAGYDILTKEENTQLWRRAGELTYKGILGLINSDKYKKAGKDLTIDPDIIKGEFIDDMIRDAKATAKLEIVMIKKAQGKTIMQLAESGLFSVDEFEMLKNFNKSEGR